MKPFSERLLSFLISIIFLTKNGKIKGIDICTKTYYDTIRNNYDLNESFILLFKYNTMLNKS